MIVAGHQPQYLPYLGLFNKIAKADLFVFADMLQYSKKSWHNRTLISSLTGEELLLTIPVKTKGNFLQEIKDVQIDGDHWKKKHLKTISLNYKKTFGFEEIYPLIEKCINYNSLFLIDFTIPLMELFINLLSINIPIKRASEMGITGNKTELLIDICHKSDHDTYLSGPGAKNYFKSELFKQAKLNHLFNNFVHPEYSQKTNTFLKGMAICDIFFHEGIEEAKQIFWENVKNNPSFE